LVLVMSLRVYMDHNATAPLCEVAREAMNQAFALAGNASSVHQEGRAARQALDRARAQVALLLGVRAQDVVFTSGGTEANAMALSPDWVLDGDARRVGVFFVSSIEHPCVLENSRHPGLERHLIPVNTDGVLDVEALETILRVWSEAHPDLFPIVSVMAANNETGVVQPLARIAEVARRHGALLHTDAVQLVGKIPVGAMLFGADLISVSAHKMGGPKGVGALVVNNDALHLARPLLRGGGQERGLRSGTENVLAIVGFGAVAASRLEGVQADYTHMLALRDKLEQGILALTPQVLIVGLGVERLPNTVCALVPHVSAETLLIAFDLKGVALSSGSACSSGKVKASHVLEAMGYEGGARSALRLSFGPETTADDINRVLEVWSGVVPALLARVA
jgi:cysteine desulfurase